MNGHDLFGALQRGYAQRTRQAAHAAVANAAGWRGCSGPQGSEGSAGFGLALDALVQAAIRAGIPRERIEQALALNLRPSKHDRDEGWVERHWDQHLKALDRPSDPSDPIGVPIPRDLLEAIAPHDPMNQDEQGGCVWCAGADRNGYHAGRRLSHHAEDCPWVLLRGLLGDRLS